jgi:hypothetical protein
VDCRSSTRRATASTKSPQVMDLDQPLDLNPAANITMPSFETPDGNTRPYHWRRGRPIKQTHDSIAAVVRPKVQIRFRTYRFPSGGKSVTLILRRVRSARHDIRLHPRVASQTSRALGHVSRFGPSNLFSRRPELRLQLAELIFFIDKRGTRHLDTAVSLGPTSRHHY